MKNLSRPLINIVILFAAMFVINFAAMYVFFDINVVSPVKRTGLNVSSIATDELVKAAAPSINENGDSTGNGQISADGEMAAGRKSIDENGLLPHDTANEADTASRAVYYMTSEEVGLLADLSLPDKIEALSIISKIGKEKADKIYDIALDGVTIAEMEEIRGILEKYLSQQEMDSLNAILNKNKMLYAGQNSHSK